MSDRDPDPRPVRPWPSVSLLRRAGPVVLIVAALVAAGITATVHENNGSSSAGAPGTGSGSRNRARDGAAHLRRRSQNRQDRRL